MRPKGEDSAGEEDKITLSPKAPSRKGVDDEARDREGTIEKRGENHVP